MIVKEKFELLLSVWNTHAETCERCKHWDSGSLATYRKKVITPCPYGAELIGRMSTILRAFVA